MLWRIRKVCSNVSSIYYPKLQQFVAQKLPELGMSTLMAFSTFSYSSLPSHYKSLHIFSTHTTSLLPRFFFQTCQEQYWPNFKLVCLDPFWLLNLILKFWTAISSSLVLSHNNVLFFPIPVTMHWLILHWHLVANTEQVTFITSQFRGRRHTDVNTYLLSFHLFSFLCMSDFSYASSRFFRIWTCPFQLLQILS